MPSLRHDPSGDILERVILAQDTKCAVDSSSQSESMLRLLPETLKELSAGLVMFNCSSSVGYCFTEMNGTAAVQHCSAELAGKI